VTYGKTVAGGLPIGVLCGRRQLMRRFREDRPVDVCFARGTFNSHPYVMGAMHEFLQQLEGAELQARYRDLDALWDGRAARLNARLQAEGLNVRVANLSTIWTVCYPQPSRYNWMLQYYLRAHGLALSWVGTGRLIFSLDYDDADFAAVTERFIAAARQMQQDGWWWAGDASSNESIKRQLLREMVRARLHLPWGRSARPAVSATALGNKA
jgi:glutamate-1-semialdehyde 2,1-aminomutase